MICAALLVASRSQTHIALHKKRKSHPRQWVDAFKSCLQNAATRTHRNPPHGSVGIVQVRPIHLLFCDFASVFILMTVNSVDLNHPHTAVWGIPRSSTECFHVERT